MRSHLSQGTTRRDETRNEVVREREDFTFCEMRKS